MESPPYAKLVGADFDFLMVKKRVVVGRNSKLGHVDINIGSSRFISRRHLEVALDRNSFYVFCRGKNGIVIDGSLHKGENGRLQLPMSCMIRFPSTDIKFTFTSLLDDTVPLQPMHSPALPLKVDTPFASPFVSPAPSPTGTISAVNSCPVSPSSEYKHRVPNFDLTVMANYATRLLSNQQQHQQRLYNQLESSEAIDGSSSAPDSTVVNPKATKAPPTRRAVEERGDEEEEEEGGENNGEVPNEIVAGKQEEASSQDGGTAAPSERTQQKPPFSYAQLIVQALLAAKDRRQTLSNIYAFIADMYPYYKLGEKGWKNSIRHNLSLNQYFMKAPREKEGLGFGKGGYWCMHPDYEDKLTSQAYVKRKKKGIPVFPSAHLVSRSAPPSPTHHPIHNDMGMKEMGLESKFTLPVPPTTSHFTLPPFFPHQMPAAMNSSHSLPASPSRPPPSFTATPLKFFPMQGRASDDMDLLKSQRKMCETIHEEMEDSEHLVKRPRFDDSLVEGGVATHAGMVPIPTMSSVPRMQFAQAPGGAPLQFLPISLVSSAPQQPHQNLLGAPLSSFLPQSYFNRAGQVSAVSPIPQLGNQPPSEARNGTSAHGNVNEG